MKYWPQQLNFAVFYAMLACRISRETFNSGLSLPLQIRACYTYHMHFMVRQFLYQMDEVKGIQALPEDNFQSINQHNIPSYKRICNKFELDSSSDFRFTHRKNQALGSVYVYGTGASPMKTGMSYPGFYKFSHGEDGHKGTCFISYSLIFLTSTTSSLHKQPLAQHKPASEV